MPSRPAPPSPRPRRLRSWLLPVASLVRKEFRQVLRDRAMIGVLFVVPLIQITILGNAVSSDVRHVRVAVHDADGTPMSRELSRALFTGETFDPAGTAPSLAALQRMVDDGHAKIGVSIPRGFQRMVVRGETPAVQAMVDGMDGNSAGVSIAALAGIVQLHQSRLAAQDPALARQLGQVRPVVMEPRFWFNPDLRSQLYIVPGIVAMILTIITTFLTSMGIVREKEIGTLDQLMVTPIRASQLIIGKVLPFSVLGFIEISISMGFVFLLFGIGVRGSVLLLFAESGLFILTTLGVGILISTVSETQQQALFVAWFFMIFGILLSGFFIPIENMPPAVRTLTLLNPLRYYLLILREIYLKGTPLSNLLRETGALALFGFSVLSLAVLRFRRTLR